jgi:uncharacterized oxidoreductase
MFVCDNTVLITGGTSGIGLELATQLLALGNTVIVTGRSQSSLDATMKKLSGIHVIQNDVSDPAAIVSLYQQVVEEFSGLNVLINSTCTRLDRICRTSHAKSRST